MLHQWKHIDITFIHIILFLVRPEHLDGRLVFTQGPSPYFAISTSVLIEKKTTSNTFQKRYHISGISLTLVYSSTNMLKLVWLCGFWKPPTPNKCFESNCYHFITDRSRRMG